MTRVEEIKAAIDKLSLSEQAELAKLLHGWTDDEWDQQMKEDLEAGRLDKFLKQVDDKIDAGDLRDLP